MKPSEMNPKEQAAYDGAITACRRAGMTTEDIARFQDALKAWLEDETALPVDQWPGLADVQPDEMAVLRNDLREHRGFLRLYELVVQGNAAGQFQLGCLQALGHKAIKRNAAQAVRLWHLAASQGHVAAQANLKALIINS